MLEPRPAPPVRYAKVHHGDDMRRISLREMGDASRWVDLVILNGLRPPYIAEEPELGVLTYGDAIMVPVADSAMPADLDAEALFGTDLIVRGKRLDVENGDFAIVSGIANLKQALTHHIIVQKGELGFHPEFGSHVRSIIGQGNGPSAGGLAAFYVKSALLEDQRIQEVPTCEAQVEGDHILVRAVAVPISGEPVELRVNV